MSPDRSSSPGSNGSNSSSSNKTERKNPNQKDLVNASSQSRGASSEDSEPRRTARTRTLQEIYDVTEADTNNVSLFCLMTECEPLCFEEAAKDKNWKRVMDEEIDAISRNETWDLMDLPKGCRAIGVKWIFKLKKNDKGHVLKHKARLVAKGYNQVQGVDFEDVFAPVARLETVRLLFAIAAQFGWIIHQMDFKSAFLNGDLQENVYVRQPPGYIVKGQENRVLKLRKALYGLRQAPRTWNTTLDRFLKVNDFSRCPHEYAVYVKKDGHSVLIVCIYVDDILITGNEKSQIERFKEDLAQSFDMTDLGEMCFYLGIKVEQKPDGIFASQQAYIYKVLRQFNMSNCSPVDTPISMPSKTRDAAHAELVNSTLYRSLVGSLRYITCTRPDILYAVGFACRFMDKPTEEHMTLCKRIMRYLKGTINHGLLYTSGHGRCELKGYSDSDWGGDLDTRRSTTGFLFSLGTTAFSWASKLQPIVALSSAEAEYIALASCASHASWLRQLLSEMHLEQKSPIELYVDNQSAIAIARNPVYHDRSKHIDVRFHFLRDLVGNGAVSLVHVRSKDQLADLLTKALPAQAFVRLRNLLGVVDSSLKGVCEGMQA